MCFNPTPRNPNPKPHTSNPQPSTPNPKPLHQELSEERAALEVEGERLDGHAQVMLSINVQRFRGGLVFKAHRRLYHSTLGLRVIKKKNVMPSTYERRLTGQSEVFLKSKTRYRPRATPARETEPSHGEPAAASLPPVCTQQSFMPGLPRS